MTLAPLRSNPRRAAAPSLAAMMLMLLASTAAAQTTASTLSGRKLFVAATHDVTWLVRPMVGPEKELSTSTVLRRWTKTDGSTEWRTFALLAQRPRAIASFGERLAVLYFDGSWSLLSAAGQSNGPPPPDDLKLVALLDGTDRLTFLARPKSPGDGLYLIDFDGRDFSRPRPAQVSEDAASHALRVAARADATFLVENEVPGESPEIAGSSDGRLHAIRNDSSVTISGVDGTRMTITPPPAAVAGRLTLSRDVNGDARLWWLEGDSVMSQAYAADGSPRAAAAAVTVRPPPSPPLFERGLYVVGALALLMVLLAGGRQTLAVTRAIAAKTPPPPAPLARRFAAGIIDCFPIAATAVYLVVGGKLTIFGGMLQFDNLRSEAILAAGVLLYLTLLIACELRWNRSLGKAIFALRVVGIDGQTPRPRAVLVRNVLRLVDLNLITLLIVPATPLRQRLGDFLAGTMVIDSLHVDSASGRVTPDDPADNN